MSQVIQMSKSTLRQFVREQFRVNAEEWVTPKVWMERTGKGQGALSYALVLHPELSKKEPGIRCAINWTEYIKIYPVSKEKQAS